MSDLIPHLQELWQPWAPVRSRRMFGGYGLYRDDLMFALIVDDELFLKVDRQSEPDFEELGLDPFVYYRQGKPVNLSFRQAPAEMFDESELACEWAQRAWQAAIRARSKKSGRDSS